MPGLYVHTQRVSGDTITANVYNGDHVQHVDGKIPELMDDASADVLAMQSTTDPGDVGSEVLASNLLGEIERIRFQIAALVAQTEWYEAPNTTLYTGTVSGHIQAIDFRTADFTLAAADADKQLDCEHVDGLTITVPANSDVALPVGFVVTVLQSGQGQVVFSAGSGVTIRTRSTLKTNVQWSPVFLYQRVIDEWVVTGGLL